MVGGHCPQPLCLGTTVSSPMVKSLPPLKTEAGEGLGTRLKCNKQLGHLVMQVSGGMKDQELVPEGVCTWIVWWCC